MAAGWGWGWEGPHSSLGALGGDLGHSGWGGGEGEQALPQGPRWADRVLTPHSTTWTLCLRTPEARPAGGDSSWSYVPCPQHALLILPADLTLGFLPPTGTPPRSPQECSPTLGGCPQDIWV